MAIFPKVKKLLAKNKAWGLCAIFCLFCLWSFWVYRDGLVGVPRSDQFPFMEERGFYGSDWEYFQNIFSFNSTRHVLNQYLREDTVILRPGLLGWLALQDIFFRDNFYVIGTISLIWHALIVFLLFCLLKKLMDRWLSFMIAVVFSIQYTGMEMVMWRNISPVMVSLIFFSLGLLLVRRLLRFQKSMDTRFPSVKVYPLDLETSVTENKKAKWVLPTAIFCFFFASLFHEAVLLVLGASGVLFLFAGWRNQKEEEGGISRKSLIALCFLPLALNLAVNLPQIVNSASTLTGSRPAEFVSWLTLWKFVKVAGLYFLVFLAPQIVQFRYKEVLTRLPDRAVWGFSGPAWCPYLLGIIILVFLFWFLADTFLRHRKDRRAAEPIITMFAVMFYLVLSIALLLGRVVPRGFGYLGGAIYYHYVTNFALFLILGCAAWRFRENFKANAKLMAAATVVLVLGFPPQAVVSYEKIQEVLKDRVRIDTRTADFTFRTAKFFKEHKDYCYGGSPSELFSSFALPVFLYRQSCSVRSGTPLYVIDGPDGNLWTATLELEEGAEESFVHGELSGDHLVFSKSPSDESFVLPRDKIVTQDAYDPTLFQVEVQHGGALEGMFVHYIDEDHFVFLVAHDYYFYVVVVDGVRSDPLFGAHQVFDRQSYTLSLRKIGQDYFAFYNRNLISKFKMIQSLHGKVGLYDSRQSPRPVSFSNVMLSERQSSSGGFGYYFKLANPFLKVARGELRQEAFGSAK